MVIQKEKPQVSQDGSLRRNEDIYSKKPIRVIGPNGEQLGIMLVEQARMRAKELELDLVEVSPNSNPVVCKIMDYGKYQYHLAKKQKKSTNHAQKELYLRPRISDHDLNVKLSAAKRFLAAGHTVRVVMRFNGRELCHKDLGEKILNRVKAALSDSASASQCSMPVDGRDIVMTLTPGRKS